jgi:hypothetical protein
VERSQDMLSLVDIMHTMEQGLDKANLPVFGLHCDFSTTGAVIANNITCFVLLSITVLVNNC